MEDEFIRASHIIAETQHDPRRSTKLPFMKKMKTETSSSGKSGTVPMQAGSSRANTYIALAALIISIASAVIAYTVYSHQQLIEESDLQIGPVQFSSDEPSIRIPLINGYYARYPALIVSYRGFLNGKEIKLTDVPQAETNVTQYPKNFRFVERDKPVHLDIVFAEPPNFTVYVDDLLSTIKVVTPITNLKEGKNELIVEIHYHDFSKKSTWAISPKIEFNFQNGKLLDANVVYIGKDKVKQLP